jgi:hypothetical protein
MKKIVPILLILFLVSCQKDKQVSIVGSWKETAVYIQDNSGNYKWSDIVYGFPYVMYLNGDGTYSGFQCTPIPGGVYHYNHANKQIRFEAMTSGSISVVSVALLDDDNLILDYGMTSLGEYKVKFSRN